MAIWLNFVVNWYIYFSHMVCVTQKNLATLGHSLVCLYQLWKYQGACIS
jgi:hypothetical protein